MRARSGRADGAERASTVGRADGGGKDADNRADGGGKGADSRADGRMGPMRRRLADGQKRARTGPSTHERANGRTRVWWSGGLGRTGVLAVR